MSRKSFACPKCGEVGTLVEVADSDGAGGGRTGAQVGLKTKGAKTPTRNAQKLSKLNASVKTRIKTGVGELDRVLGGGFVPAEVVLFAGSPGAGKSTLALTIAQSMSKQGLKVLYSSGEESEEQIYLRAERIGALENDVLVTSGTHLEELLGQIEQEKPDFLILDSLQTIASSAISGSIGSIQQSKECAHALTNLAKKQGIIMLIINQVVKGGDDFAGSNQVSHIVDATLMLDADDESPLKMLRALKNRFGDTSEVGLFRHEDKGLVEIPDPTVLYEDEEKDDKTTGTAFTFISEGNHQIPVEINALVITSGLPNPRKQFSGVDYNRGQIACAIASRYTSLQVYEKDVFLSTVAGVRIQDTQADLAIVASLVSSASGVAVPDSTVFIGETSLTGKIRGNYRIREKVKEAIRLGYTTFVLPANTRKEVNKLGGSLKGVKIHYVSKVSDLSRVLNRL